MLSVCSLASLINRCSSICLFLGVQRQVVHCVERTSGIVEEHYCDPSTRPDDVQTSCNKEPCPAMWVLSKLVVCRRVSEVKEQTVNGSDIVLSSGGGSGAGRSAHLLAVTWASVREQCSVFRVLGWMSGKHCCRLNVNTCPSLKQLHLATHMCFALQTG